MTNPSIYIDTKHQSEGILNEYLMLVSFLSYLTEEGALQDYFDFPFRIEKTESPDFVINQKYGIEVCFAIPKNYRYAQHIRESKPDGSIIEVDRGLCTDDNMTRKAVEGFIKGPNDKLTMPPLYGNAREDIWADRVSKLILSKTEKLNCHYKSLEKYILLVNADFYLCRKKDIAERYLQEKLQKINLPDCFNMTFAEIIIIYKLKGMSYYQVFKDETQL